MGYINELKSATDITDKALKKIDDHFKVLNSPILAGDFNLSVLDPAATGVGGMEVLPFASGYRTFALTTGDKINRHYVADIETFGKDPEHLHLGVFMDIEDPALTAYEFRTWDTFVHQMAIPALFKAKRSRIWAHYGAGFDWNGMAFHMDLNYGVDEKIMLNLDYMKSLINPAFEPNKRGPKTKKEVEVEISIEKFGDRKLIVFYCEKGDYRLEFIDSYYHLEAPLAKLADKNVAKTKTPEQYTNPIEWLHKNGFDNYRSPEAMEFWFNTKPDDALEYCANDCRVLANALNKYREFGLHNFDIDPLDFMTAPKAALAASIKMAQNAIQFNGRDTVFVHNPKTYRAKGFADWDIQDRSSVKCPPIFDKDKNVVGYHEPNLKDKPVAHRSEFTVAESSYYCYDEYAMQFTQIVFGGRTEVFANRTREGMRPVVADAKSHYPTMMAFMDFIDPRGLRYQKTEIVGKADILKHLKDHSGKYWIESEPARNPLFKKYPLFPIRMASNDRDSRNTYADWEGKIRLFVSGEELQYFVEHSGVEDIRILPGKTIIGNKLWKDVQGPLKEFALKLYSLRKDAAQDNDALYEQLCKLWMNAGGFGPHSERREHTIKLMMAAHDAPEDLKISAGKSAQEAMLEMFKMDPLYAEWTEHSDMLSLDATLDRDYCRRAMDFAKRWGNLRWRTFNKYKQKKTGTIVMEVAVKEFLASHSITPWAAQITAAGRVSLHKMMINVHNTKLGGVPLQLCYSDTDSVHFGVPEAFSDQEVVDELQRNGVKMALSLEDKVVQANMAKAGFPLKPGMTEKDEYVQQGLLKARIRLGGELGEWAIEKIKRDEQLLGKKLMNAEPACGIYLAPKTYLYIDKDNNVIRSVAKGIPASHPAMRAALVSISIKPSKLGAKRGLDEDVLSIRDAIKTLSVPRRDMYDDYDSMPLVLRQPMITEDMNWHQYCRAVSTSFAGVPSMRGQTNAADFMRRECRAFGIPVSRIHKTLKQIEGDVVDAMSEVDEDGFSLSFSGNELDLMVRKAFEEERMMFGGADLVTLEIGEEEVATYEQ